MVDNKILLTKTSVKKIVISSIFIFSINVFVFLPALRNHFVWDDYKYVYENTKIQSLNVQSLNWMLTSFHASNWHPLTWLSHALDYTYWGLNPRGHHLTNIIVHGLNALLVFFLVMRIMLASQKVEGNSPSSNLPRSGWGQSLSVAGITALLFGLHPLRVESVAWIAERKDLLCAFFFFLTLLCYISYRYSASKKNRWRWFILSLLLFFMALMSKPMAVTLPFTLLLLDFYPLRRYQISFRNNLSVLLEKIPFISLSIASSIITIMAQSAGKSIKSFEYLPIDLRLLNAAHSLVFYLQKMIWPLELVPFYPFHADVSLFNLRFIIASILILAITGVCVFMITRKHYLLFAVWSYYVITLLPVLGIIQVGSQSAADRYTYLPSISIFLLAGIGVDWIWRKISLTRFKRVLRGALLGGTGTILVLLSSLTINQIKIWRDSEIFWRYIISAFPTTFPEAYTELGVVYVKSGRLDEAIELYERALAINPFDAKTYANLGSAYGRKGMWDEAISACVKALAVDPTHAIVGVYSNLGLIYDKKGNVDEAISQYKKAIALDPFLAEVHYNLGLAYAKKGEIDEAIAAFKKALAVKPNLAGTHYNLAAAYYKKGNNQLAILHFEKASSLGYKVPHPLLERLKSDRYKLD
jgi:tetratricopeptide (TPR) repeat protein